MRADSAGLDAAAAALRAGEVVLLPTDTTYGLAASTHHPAAVAQLFVLKRRPAERSIALLVADLEQAHELGCLTTVEQAVAAALWPGALTMVVRRRADTDPTLGREDGTIALRWPDHDFVRALATEVGPLATTSANISGRPTPNDAYLAAASLDGEVAVVIDAGECPGIASTVARIDESGEVEVLRRGEMTRHEISDAVHRKDSGRN